MKFSLIHWAEPSYAWSFLLLVPLILMFGYHFLKMARVIRALYGPAGVRTNYRVFICSIFRAVCTVLGAFFLLLTLLRPQWDKKEEHIQLHGRDVVVALDISRSMLCQDMRPNRLEAAKEKILNFTRKLPSGRKGLILFAGEPFVICPLTQDHDSFVMFLNQVDASTISAGGTSLDKALRQAIAILKKMADRKNKIVVVFTDGEDFSDSLADIEKEVAEYGLHIFVVCMGTVEGGPIPLYDDKGALIGHQKNNDGSIVITKPHFERMNKLVQSGGGAFIRASQSMADVDELVGMIGKFEKEKLDMTKKEVYQEKYHYCAAVSFILLCLACLL